MTNIAHLPTRPQRPAVPPALRRRLETIAERLIGLLDELDAPNEDLEDTHDAEADNADAEPSLGATHHTNQAKAWNSSPGDDLEFEGDTVADCDLEEQHDREHDEAELSGIGDADGLDEQRDGEPWLGATNEEDQHVAWAHTWGRLPDLQA